ncbi:MAG: tetratricopeptide repeat protein [Bacteroidales bacterium]|jgi:tetratricopeptide (TPR) repeat protein|nr:tetratricopeptide repeat protein [Bacteroidales bacterium]
MRKFIFQLLILQCLSSLIFAQNKEIDSLENLLQQHPPMDTSRISLLNKIADKLVYSDPEKTLQYARQADSLAGIFSFAKGKAMSLLMKGKSFFLLSDFDNAIECLQGAIQLYQELGDSTGVANSYLIIGNIYSVKGDYPKSLEYLQRSLRIFEELNYESGMVKCYNNIGVNYTFQGNNPKSLEFFQLSLKLCERLNDKRGMQNAFNNIGTIYTAQRDISKSLDYLQKALKLSEELNDEKGIAYALGNIGNVYAEQKDYSKAMEYQQKALKISEDVKDMQNMAVCHNNIGLIHLNQGDYSKALESLRKGLKIAKEINMLQTITESYIGFCQVYIKLKNYPQAIIYGEKGYSSGIAIGSKQTIVDASDLLSQAYAEVGNYQKAYKFHIEYKNYSDSLLNEENTKKLTGLEYTYKYEKEKELAAAEQQNKDAIQAEKIKRQKIIRNSFMAGFTMVLGLLFYVFYNLNEKKKTNRILSAQKAEIETAHGQIKDSINYAKYIQSAILNQKEMFDEYFREYFIFFMPKDIVSGDFYWGTRIEGLTIIAAVDCTGHGVPGAFMSMLGSALLNQIVNKEYITHPGVILRRLRKEVIRSLHQKGHTGELKDGMDIVLCVIDFEKMKLQFSGANNPLYLIRNISGSELNTGSSTTSELHALYEIRGDRMPISIHDAMEDFKVSEVDLEPGDMLYLFSDGYADQFGGHADKKLNYRTFRNILLNNAGFPMAEQKKNLEIAFNEWKGNLNQVDDVLVVGIKV